MGKVSVALATFNGAKYLEEQLATLAAQTLLPYELVIADDGSADDTLPIVRRFGATAPFAVRVIEGAGGLGYRLNFRRAAQASTGDLIAFCDQDDVWYASKLERMVRCFDDPKVLLAYHNATITDGSNRWPLYFARQEERNARGPFRQSAGLVQVFRAELRRHDDLWDLSTDHLQENVILAHDQWYFFVASLLGKVLFVDETLLDYRQHSSNVSGAGSEIAALASPLRHFLRRFVHYGEQDAWAQRSAANRSRIAEIIAAREQLTGVAELARQYELLADRYARRAKMYSGSTIFDRTKAFVDLLTHNGYSSKTWAFPHKAMLRDLWSGLIRRQATDPTMMRAPAATNP